MKLPSTIWYGQFSKVKRVSHHPCDERKNVRTIWGRMPIGEPGHLPANKALQSELGIAATRILSKGSKARKSTRMHTEFCTVWFNCYPPHRRHSNASMLYARTVWGSLPLFDGRISLYFPGTGDDPFRFRYAGYSKNLADYRRSH